MARPRKNPASGDDGLYPMVVTAACILLGSDPKRQGDEINVPEHVRATLLQAKTARDA